MSKKSFTLFHGKWVEKLFALVLSASCVCGAWAAEEQASQAVSTALDLTFDADGSAVLFTAEKGKVAQIPGMLHYMGGVMWLRI